MSGTYQVQPPEPFSFSRPSEWPKWARRFERFRVASGLGSKGEEVQVNTLLYAMGDDADDILRSFQLSAADQKKYSEVKGRFDQHFVKKRNVIFERARFNRRKQEEGETVDAFVTDLYALAEHCSYAGLHNEMIRDRLVVGLLSASLSERLQLDPDLTLEKAITQARQAEAIKLQQPLIRGEGAVKPDLPVGAVQQGRPSQNRSREKGTNWQRQSQETQALNQPHATCCPWCGLSPKHDQARCPARGAVCRNCGKRGHYRRVCRSQAKVDTVEEGSESFLGAVSSHDNTTTSPWVVTVWLNDTLVQFQIDTGAEVTVIRTGLYEKLSGASLHPPQRTLRGASQNVLPVKGQFTGRLRREDRTTHQEVYVVDQLHKPLLGRPAIEALGLLARIRSVREETNPAESFPKLFEGLGRMHGEYSIQLKEGAVPFALTTPRRVAIPLMESVRAELQKMEMLGVISRIETPTDWCAGMVVVPKPNKRVRICVDLTKLNENVRRERHPLPAVEQILAQIAGARVFSKLDANSGFWQIPLSAKSIPLTTFITPFGRYCFNRLPFGITSAPEHFQRRMAAVLQGIDGVVCLMDDVLVHGRTQREHDERLDAVLKRIQEAGITLNREKCSFSQPQVKFLGQVLSPSGISSDPDKVAAILQMREPTSVPEVRRFLGMTNQLSKFTPNLADMTKPLRDLLSHQNEWSWGEPQKSAFTKVKEALTQSPVLAAFDPALETTVSADASSYGIGSVLLQKQKSGERRPVAYISRAMTPTEQRYAQIEKEALALTWASERLEDYLLGLHFCVETDHKPLVPLFSNKLLDDLPLRIQRFRMRMMRFSFSINHVPGKQLSTADALSRAPVNSAEGSDNLFREEVEAYIQTAVQSLPATEGRLKEIRVSQFHTVSGELTITDGILMRGGRIVIPRDLQSGVLRQLHSSHQGISKSRERAKQSVWWPGLSKQLEETVQKCPVCIKFQVPRAEPLLSSEIPSLPWQKVGTDLFEWEKSNYLLIVDYQSRWIEIVRLPQTTSRSIVNHMSSIFARYGIPELVVSDNGPQYSSDCFKEFARTYGFQHVTSSPHYPQANGEAERAVQTIKGLLKKAPDPYLALLAYRATPLALGYTPSELLMGRKLRTTVPMTRELRKPAVPNLEEVAERDRREKQRQTDNFNAHHGARALSPLSPGDTVYLKDRASTGTVARETAPRSYEVQTPDGTVRRNRRHMVLTDPTERDDDSQYDLLNPPSLSGDSRPDRIQPSPTTHPKEYSTRSRSGQAPKPPERFDSSWTHPGERGM